MKIVNCKVIQDLLPSYIDKISSQSTNMLIEEHLAERCRNNRSRRENWLFKRV